MALTRRRMLGLMLTDRSVTAAAVRVGGGEGPTLEAVAALDLDGELTWDEPARIGTALAERLRQAGVKARHAVVGLPAAWVLTRSVEAPPARGEALRKIVATKAERAFAGGGRELAIDYLAGVSDETSGSGDALTPRRVLLIAAQQQRVSAAVAMAEAAGLRVDTVTATAAVVAMSADGAGRHGGRSVTLMLGREASELAVAHGGTLESIRPLRKVSTAARGDAGRIVAGQLRQFRVLAGGEGDDPAQPARDDAPGSLWLWDAVGLDEASRQAIAAEAGVSQLEEGDLEEWVHANGTISALGEPLAAGRYVGAVALARAGVEPAEEGIDWLDSRLAEPRRQLVSQRWQMVIAVAAVLLIVGMAVSLHYRAAAADVALLETQLAGMQEDVAAARVVVARVDRAEGWFDHRPSVLACLEGLTAAFGTDPGVWATELSLDETLSGTVAGRAVDGRQVLEVRDRMQGAAAFTNVALIYMREAERGGGQELTWSISFDFVAQAEPAPASGEEAGQEGER